MNGEPTIHESRFRAYPKGIPLDSKSIPDPSKIEGSAMTLRVFRNVHHSDGQTVEVVPGRLEAVQSDRFTIDQSSLHSLMHAYRNIREMWAPMDEAPQSGTDPPAKVDTTPPREGVQKTDVEEGGPIMETQQEIHTPKHESPPGQEPAHETPKISLEEAARMKTGYTRVAPYTSTSVIIEVKDTGTGTGKIVKLPSKETLKRGLDDALKVQEQQLKHDRNAGLDLSFLTAGLMLEFDLLRRLEHPHVVRVTNLVYVEIDDLQIPGIMEEKCEPIQNHPSIAEVLEIGDQIAEALEFIHTPVDSGKSILVHTDIKDTNIMKKSGGGYCIIDFGNVSVPRDTGSPDRTEGPIGSFGFADPDRRTHPNTLPERADQYSLAMTVFYLLGGDSPPFVSTDGQTSRYESGDDYILRDLPPEIPSEAISVLRKATHPDRSKRYNDESEMMSELRKAIISV